RMLKGMAATAVEMENVVPGAFKIKELLRRQSLKERLQLSPEIILADIDFDHQDLVAALDFLRTLIHFVAALSQYWDILKILAAESLKKFPLPKTRRTKIYPLGCNSFDEIQVQELKKAMEDFMQQMGVDEDNLNGRCFVASGDGKTFNQLQKL
ncbi:hypothetical protein H0H81_002265, partial [Sphagnurus paluster]